MITYGTVFFISVSTCSLLVEINTTNNVGHLGKIEKEEYLAFYLPSQN